MSLASSVSSLASSARDHGRAMVAKARFVTDACASTRGVRAGASVGVSFAEHGRVMIIVRGNTRVRWQVGARKQDLVEGRCPRRDAAGHSTAACAWPRMWPYFSNTREPAPSQSRAREGGGVVVAKQEGLCVLRALPSALLCNRSNCHGCACLSVCVSALAFKHIRCAPSPVCT